MEWSIFLALVICITVANAKPSGTSKENPTEDGNSTTDPLAWLHTLTKNEVPHTPTRNWSEIESRLHNLTEDAFNLVFYRINSMVRELAQKSFQNSKPKLEQRFRKLFPTCERAVVDTMLQDVSEKIQETEPYPCYGAVDPIYNNVENIMKDVNEHLEYFKSQKNETVNDDEKNLRLKKIRDMENQISGYKKSNLESEELGLYECFTNFVDKTMDKWDDVVVPEDKCETPENYNALFNNKNNDDNNNTVAAAP